MGSFPIAYFAPGLAFIGLLCCFAQAFFPFDSLRAPFPALHRSGGCFLLLLTEDWVGGFVLAPSVWKSMSAEARFNVVLSCGVIRGGGGLDASDGSQGEPWLCFARLPG